MKRGRKRKTRAFKSARRPSAREAFLSDVATMAGEIYDHAQAHIDAEAARVRKQALDAVRAILETKMVQPALPAAPAPPPRKPPVAPSSRPATAPVGDHPRQKNGKAPPSCSLCGKVGKSSRTCGKSPDHPGTGEAPPSRVHVTPEMARSLEPQPKPPAKGKASTISGSARAALERTRAARGPVEPELDDDEDDLDGPEDILGLDDPAALDDDDDDDQE